MADELVQNCGPIAHFHARERDETLHVIARCTACDTLLQPLSEDQVSQMRRGIALIRRSQRRPEGVGARTRDIEAAAAVLAEPVYGPGQGPGT